MSIDNPDRVAGVVDEARVPGAALQAQHRYGATIKVRSLPGVAGKDKRRILEEFIAATGYHVKSAIRVLNGSPVSAVHRIRNRPSIYDEATRGALVVLWEASDRLCGKRLHALLPLLLPALERNGHLRLDETIRKQLQAMSAATMDRMLREARNATRPTKRRRSEPSARRRIALRTFADWNEPTPGCMEMDLVAHCGEVNRGSFIHSPVLTDVASGWTEAAPLVVRESGLVVETLDRIREGLPFALKALDVDNGAEFVNERLIQYCLGHGIDAIATLSEERPRLDRAEEWRRGAKAPGLSALPGVGCGPGDDAPARRRAAVRQLLPAVLQTGGEASGGCSGLQALPPAPDPVRAAAAVPEGTRGGQGKAAGGGRIAESTAAARGNPRCTRAASRAGRRREGVARNRGGA